MMRTVCRRLLLLPPFYSCILLAQLQPLGGIGGQLRTVGGDSPSHQIMVELRLRGATISSVYTDAQGRFSFNNLEGNPYHVVINDDAYSPVDELVTIRPESPNVYLQLFLRAREQTRGALAPSGNRYMVNAADYNKHFSKKAVKEYQRGVDAERKGKLDEAIPHYLEALKIAPDYYPAHNNLGTLFERQTDFKAAEEQFREAIRVDPNDAQAYLNLGNVLLLTRRYPESRDAIQSGLQRDPTSAFGYFLQGSLAEQTGNYAQAERNLEEALRLNSTMWQAQIQLVNAYLQQGRRIDAIDQLQAFLKAFPTVAAAPRARQLLQQLQAGPAGAANH